MNSVPEGLLRTLSALDPAAPYALLVRHAAREEVPPDDPYADVDLTPAGVAAARALGVALGGTLRWAASSPFLRCRRTVREIAGATSLAAEEDRRLGAHGPWVLDHEAGARLFAELGPQGVVRGQIERLPWPCLRTLEEGTRVLLGAALERLADGASGLCVSHDAVLMPAIAHLTGDRFEGRWLQALDGIAVQPRGGALRVWWRGEFTVVRPC